MEDIEVQVDSMNSSNFDPNFNAQRPTGTNIKKALTRLITTAQAGDILVFHFSGHGMQLPDKSGDEADGKDEAIVATVRRAPG